MAEAVKEYLGVDFMAITSDEEAVKAAKAVGVDMEKVEPTWGHALYECYDQKVEEKMVQPTFITMHPVDVSPLAKRSPKDPRLTERFELFICRSEMGNAFSELNDPIDQEQRFLKQMELRAKGDTTTTLDEVLHNVTERDRIDTTRAESPLRQADDAVVLDNSNMTIPEQNAFLRGAFLATLAH